MRFGELTNSAMHPIIINGKRASKLQNTLIARLLLNLRTSQMDASWKILVNMGRADNKPIWKFEAPISMAKAIRNVPCVNTIIASVVIPSTITRLNPLFTTCWESMILGFKFM